MAINVNSTKNSPALCFVANFHKTVFFHEVAQRLLSSGIAIYWVVTKSDQYKYLQQIYPKENVLYINRSFIQKSTPVIDDFKINELVYGDRVLKTELSV